ncbi:MAG: beta-ribofuranosylaminobenzene 5'-phosphate synthase [Methylophagaceae bacterium]
MTLKQHDNTHPNTAVRVSAPARLHLGFLDLNGDSGRKFGSIGLAINSYHTIIKVQRAKHVSVTSHYASPQIIQKAEFLLGWFYQTIGKDIAASDQSVAVTIEKLIPDHAGFGSGTQLALTIGTALCHLHGINATPAEIAQQLGRGKRSGIGIATFELGGFIIDGGNKPNHSIPPPLLAHHQLPSEWRMVLIMDPEHKGVHGLQEKNAFATLAKFPLVNSQAICHISLMQLLPALVEKDLDLFGNAITKIQQLIGDHFAPAQGGRYTSKNVAHILKHAHNLGHVGIAQSSWGPTGVVFVDSENSATSLIADLMTYTQSTLPASNKLNFSIAQANRHGAIIETTS